MNGFFFFYTMAILFVCAFSGLVALICAVGAHRRICYAEALMFFAYLAELGSIFFNEYLSQNLEFPLDLYYDIDSPATRIAVGALIITAGGWALFKSLGVPSGHPMAFFLVGYTAISFAVVYAMPYGALRQWCFYTARQVYMGAILAYAGWFYAFRAAHEVKLHLAKYKPFFWLLVAGLFAITLEDAVVILALDPAQSVQALPLYLSERNFSENLLLVALAVLVDKSNIETLFFRMGTVPTAEKNIRQNIDPEKVFDSQREQIMPRFASDKELTPREREVLALLLEGKSNTEIAGELVLSVGTVKTHIHNITKKCGASSRDEVKQLFWSA